MIARLVRPLSWLTLLLAVVPLAAGCASLRLKSQEETPSQKRQRRDAEIVRQFEEKRNGAECQAALHAWQTGETASCRQRLEVILTRSPKHREANLLQIEVQLAANQPQEALKLAERLLADRPNDAEVQYAMGLSLDAAGRGAEAVPYYEKAAAADPNNEVYVVGYRTALETSQKPGFASTADSPRPLGEGPGAKAVGSGTTIGTSPRDNPFPKGEGRDRSAVPDPTDGRSDRVVPVGGIDRRDLSVRDPAAVLVEKGQAALAEPSPQQAIVFFREAARLKPDNPQILISAATAALGANQPEVAIELLAPEGKPVADVAAVHRILGTAYYRRGDYASSQTSLRQALSLDNTNALTYFLMGCTLAKQGQPEAADTYFRQARSLDPRYVVQR